MDSNNDAKAMRLYVIDSVFETLEPTDHALTMYDRIMSRLLAFNECGQLSLYRRAIDAVNNADASSLRLAFEFCKRWELNKRNQI